MTTHRRTGAIGPVGFVGLSALILSGIFADAEQAPSAGKPGTQTGQIIRSRVDLITSDVFVRDDRGMFVADLKKEDFEIYEDGVPQTLITLTLSHGGRVLDFTSPAAASTTAGVVVPPSRLPNNSGRIFLLFVDDLHLNFMQTGRIRALFKALAEEVVHEGDMFGIVSTGPSSLVVDLTYDRKRLTESIRKISGSALTPRDIVAAPQGAQGGAEVRHRAHVAFSTAHSMLGEIERIHDRRKAFIYVSNGYDFDAFSESRLKEEQDRYGRADAGQQGTDPFSTTSNKFNQADLMGELAAVIRAANRANASIYAVDPRGLEAGPDLPDNLRPVEWQRHLQTTQDTLRVLADQTGGFAIVNQNSFSDGLKRIDAETGDYYVIGYYSSNADPLKRRRAIEIKVKRPRVEVKHRAEYFLKPKER